MVSFTDGSEENIDTTEIDNENYIVVKNDWCL